MPGPGAAKSKAAPAGGQLLLHAAFNGSHASIEQQLDGGGVAIDGLVNVGEVEKEKVAGGEGAGGDEEKEGGGDEAGQPILTTALHVAVGGREAPALATDGGDGQGGGGGSGDEGGGGASGCRAEAATRLLLDRGADPNVTDSAGFTPLMQAAFHGSLAGLRLLLAVGAEESAVREEGGGTAFHFACGQGHADCAEELLRAGCDAGQRDSAGRTGWDWALGNGRTAVLARLHALTEAENAQLRQENARLREENERLRPGTAVGRSSEGGGVKRGAAAAALDEEEGQKHGADGQKVLYAGFAFPCVADPA